MAFSTDGTKHAFIVFVNERNEIALATMFEDKDGATFDVCKRLGIKEGLPPSTIITGACHEILDTYSAKKMAVEVVQTQQRIMAEYQERMQKSKIITPNTVISTPR